MLRFLASFSILKIVLYSEAAYDKVSRYKCGDPFCVADNANDVRVQSTPLNIYTYFPSIGMESIHCEQCINAYVVLLYYVLLHYLHVQSVEYNNSKHIRNLIFLTDD